MKNSVSQVSSDPVFLKRDEMLSWRNLSKGAENYI